MKAIIQMEMADGKSSIVVVEQSTISLLEKLVADVSRQPQVKKALLLANNLDGRIVSAMPGEDSAARLAQYGW